MHRTAAHARLFLNDQNVGQVNVRKWVGSWGIGDFQPAPGYSDFAPIYDRWAALMKEPRTRLPEETAAELRRIENATYAVKARIFLEEMDQWRDIAILNIDGPLIEWKERA